ncbi:hypothetical protein JY440_11890 [Stenotrophomonas maltophilia]|uniref:hypothetical protein n=1 Tax=Stenotrophomonas maltophilia group TaxID=995085 RepID=UPI0006AA29DF|nr:MULTISPECIES: hypothetical protein [Stenotrophomonas]MBH1540735.1 hypothetical protein [Stenotrophomonas maltophilia]MBN4983880.1 hypothetical protein [Stenotrophomonas maltophilia]MDZ7473943.1 hypothetical protein [Stenotrophomonas pavanii]
MLMRLAVASFLIRIAFNLEVSMRSFRSHAFAGALMLMPVSVFAFAPGDDHGIKMAGQGLGQSIPQAQDLSVDPGWLVYGFERDGMDYFQVNDLAGHVHIVIGNAAGTFWVLPAGDPSAKVSLPEQRLPVPAKATRTVVYRAPAFTLVRYASGADVLWAVEAP